MILPGLALSMCRCSMTTFYNQMFLLCAICSQVFLLCAAILPLSLCCVHFAEVQMVLPDFWQGGFEGASVPHCDRYKSISVAPLSGELAFLRFCISCAA